MIVCNRCVELDHFTARHVRSVSIVKSNVSFVNAFFLIHHPVSSIIRVHLMNTNSLYEQR